MIKIIINGKEWAAQSETDITILLSRFKIAPKVCVVEINSEIIPRSEYKLRTLKDGDRIEIIRLMAGG